MIGIKNASTNLYMNALSFIMLPIQFFLMIDLILK